MNTWRDELRAQVALAAPVALVNLAMLGMGVVDTIMVGRFSTEALAATRVGHSYLWCPLVFGLGVLMSLDPLVAQARGAGDEPAVARAMQRGLLVAALLMLPLLIVLLAARTVLSALHQPPGIIPEAADYALISGAGAPFLLAFVVLRQSLQAMGRLRPIVIVALIANLANALFDAVLIYGWGGLPPLGVRGCALATALCDLLMLALLLAVTRPVVGPYLWPLRARVLSLKPLLRVLRLGGPIGVQFALEVTAFNAITFMMGAAFEGPFAEVAIGGHSVALMLASVSFMVPLGVSTAAAVRVGHAVGAGDQAGVRRASEVALATGAAVMAGFALLFVTLPEVLTGVFTDDQAVLAVALSLMPLAATFQLFDGLQVVASGVLRGTGDTRWPALANLVGYWVLGLPLAWLLLQQGGQPSSLWWGLVAGLGSVAAILLARIARRLTHVLERYDVEGEGPAGPPLG